MKLTKKKEKLVRYQEERNLFAFERDGTTFVYVSKKQVDQRSISGRASLEGGAGSYATEKERAMYDCIVFPSGSTQPMPYESWLERARQFLPTASAGEALPEQLNDFSFSVPAGAVTIGPVTDARTGAIIGTASIGVSTNAYGVWMQVVKPSSEYVLDRVRQGLSLYTRGLSPPLDLDIEFASALANTYWGTGKTEFRPSNHPISNEAILEALRTMEKNGEIQIVGNKIRFVG